MREINKLRKLYKLKETYRRGRVGSRQESSAEHTWSCLMLADYFLSKEAQLNRLKVYELLLYHDVVEIEAGDTSIIAQDRSKKTEKEQKAITALKAQLPTATWAKLDALFREFEWAKTKEAKFAKAIDALEAVIHFLDYKEDWKGWNEQRVRGLYEERFRKFPEMRKAFEEIMGFCRKNHYFEQ